MENKSIMSSIDNVEMQARALKYLRSMQKDGFWPYLPGKESALEPSAWASIACRRDNSAVNEYVDALLAKQNPDGGWSNEPARLDSDWSTGAALLSLELLRKRSPIDGFSINTADSRIESACRKALTWIMDNRSERFSSAAKFVLLLWKGPEHDYERGWPWTKDTLDWVEPTSYVLLALRNSKISSDAQVVQAMTFAERYLLRVACPNGAWNCGDKIPIGTGYPPDVQTTSLALLSMIEHRNDPRVKKSLDWITQRMNSTGSVAEKSWSALALSAYDMNCQEIILNLSKYQEENGSFSKNVLTHTIASLCLELKASPHLIA